MANSTEAQTQAVSATTVPDSYIVVFKKDLHPDIHDQHCTRIHSKCTTTTTAATSQDSSETQYSGVKHRYAFHNWHGYSCTVNPETRQEIEDSDEVEIIEPDHKVHTCTTVEQREIPSWGLSRISHKAKTLTAAERRAYGYDNSAGQGVRCYVIDTGVMASHEDFAGRATFGYNAVAGSSNTDLNGHGTHVAGTIAGTKHGVAKKATIIGVKVLGDNGQGSNSTVIAGLQWAAQDATNHGAINKSVANMSLGSPVKSDIMNGAVAAVVAQGMTVCVAAGNDHIDAGIGSPSSERSCLTIGSVAISGEISGFSNFGSVVDVFAPGTNITSTWIGASNRETLTISGTSMATPHVTGLAAYLIAKEGLSGSSKVMARIVALARHGLIDGLAGLPVPGTKNLLAYNGIQG